MAYSSTEGESIPQAYAESFVCPTALRGLRKPREESCTIHTCVNIGNNSWKVLVVYLDLASYERVTCQRRHQVCSIMTSDTSSNASSSTSDKNDASASYRTNEKAGRRLPGTFK